MQRRWGIVRRKERCGAPMQKTYFRALLLLAVIWESSAIVRAASLDLPRSKSQKGQVAACADPGQSDHESIAPWRAEISRRSAFILSNASSEPVGSLQIVREKLAIESVLDDLTLQCSAIYRAHPEFKEAPPGVTLAEVSAGNAPGHRPSNGHPIGRRHNPSPTDGVIGRPSLWIAEDFGCCASG